MVSCVFSAFFLSPTSPDGCREQSSDAWPSETRWIVMNGGRARGWEEEEEEEEEEEGAQRGLLLQDWSSGSRAGHSGDWQDMQSLLIFGTFYMHGSAPTPDQGGEMLLIKPTIWLQIISGGVLLIEKKIVSTDGGGGCIRRGNGCLGWGGQRKGGGGGGGGGVTRASRALLRKEARHTTF